MSFFKRNDNFEPNNKRLIRMLEPDFDKIEWIKDAIKIMQFYAKTLDIKPDGGIINALKKHGGASYINNTNAVALEYLYFTAYMIGIDGDANVPEVFIANEIYNDFSDEVMDREDFLNLKFVINFYDLLSSPYMLDTIIEHDNSEFEESEKKEEFIPTTSILYILYSNCVAAVLCSDKKISKIEAMAFNTYLETLQSRIKAKAKFPIDLTFPK